MSTRKNTNEKEKRVRCRDCAHSTMYHELDEMGEPFLCKCPFWEWSQFLDKNRICNNFKPRKQ